VYMPKTIKTARKTDSQGLVFKHEMLLKLSHNTANRNILL